MVSMQPPPDGRQHSRNARSTPVCTARLTPNTPVCSHGMLLSCAPCVDTAERMMPVWLQVMPAGYAPDASVIVRGASPPCPNRVQTESAQRAAGSSNCWACGWGESATARLTVRCPGCAACRQACHVNSGHQVPQRRRPHAACPDYSNTVPFPYKG